MQWFRKLSAEVMFITEPSAVAPDARVYFGDFVFKTEEITKPSYGNLLRKYVDFQHPALPRSVL